MHITFKIVHAEMTSSNCMYSVAHARTSTRPTLTQTADSLKERLDETNVTKRTGTTDLTAQSLPERRLLIEFMNFRNSQTNPYQLQEILESS